MGSGPANSDVNGTGQSRQTDTALAVEDRHATRRTAKGCHCERCARLRRSSSGCCQCRSRHVKARVPPSVTLRLIQLSRHALRMVQVTNSFHSRGEHERIALDFCVVPDSEIAHAQVRAFRQTAFSIDKSHARIATTAAKHRPRVRGDLCNFC